MTFLTSLSRTREVEKHRAAEARVLERTAAAARGVAVRRRDMLVELKCCLDQEEGVSQQSRFHPRVRRIDVEAHGPPLTLFLPTHQFHSPHFSLSHHITS